MGQITAGEDDLPWPGLIVEPDAPVFSQSLEALLGVTGYIESVKLKRIGYLCRRSRRTVQQIRRYDIGSSCKSSK